MNKLILSLVAFATLTVAAQAGDLYRTENGSYVSTDFNSLSLLVHTRHGTNQYRAIRDVLIAQGTLTECATIVEVAAFNENYIATIRGQDGQYFYLPIEDLTVYLGSR